jgi:hypothetical protein
MELLFASGMAWFTFAFWDYLDVDEGKESHYRWLIGWVAKGFVLPSLFWILVATGLLPVFPFPPPISPSGPGIPGAFQRVLAAGPGLVVIGTYWLAFAMVEFFWRLAPRLPDWRELLCYAGLWAVLVSPIGVFILSAYGWLGVGAVVSLWLAPQIIQLSRCPPPLVKKPMYSRAVALMKRGKYADAEWEVIQELEKCQDDFTGWMMLAELYATRFQDLRSAEQTISDLCAQPNTTPSQAAVAIHRLADWQLQLADDPEAARMVLREIGRKYPGSHLAFMAEQRAALLPATREALIERRQVKKLALPAAQVTLEEASKPQRPELDKTEAAGLANHFSAQLAANPNDVPAREAFARVLAENLDQAKLGVEQLELLLAMPTPAASQKATWLLLQAAWQLRYLRDSAAAKVVLNRLVAEYPKLPQGFSAQRKLSRLNVEDRYRQLRQTGGIRLPDLTLDAAPRPQVQ